MKAPVGKCRYCGAEFMSRSGLQNHEQKTCEQRTGREEKLVQESAPEQPPRWRQVNRIGGGIGWVRNE